jgi:hypothetical protein
MQTLGEKHNLTQHLKNIINVKKDQNKRESQYNFFEKKRINTGEHG